jgi:hypothetical protein
VTAGALDSGHSIVVSRDGRVVVNINAGSNSISAFAATPRSLHLIGMASSGSTDPDSVTITGDNLVYVLNVGSKTIAGFEAPAGAKVAQGIPEPVPRGVGRLADPRHPVELLKRDSTPGTDQRRQLGCHPLRVRHVDQQEPGMGKVERCSLQPSAGCLRLHQREVGEVKFGDVPGHGDHASLAVHADRLTGGAHPVAEQVHDPDRAASDVDCAPARPSSYLVKQPGGLSGEDSRLPDKTLPLGIAGNRAHTHVPCQ